MTRDSRPPVLPDNLPVLTDVVDMPDAPDALQLDELALELPPELSLDEVLPATDLRPAPGDTLFDSLPSLDLDLPPEPAAFDMLADAVFEPAPFLLPPVPTEPVAPATSAAPLWNQQAMATSAWVAKHPAARFAADRSAADAGVAGAGTVPTAVPTLEEVVEPEAGAADPARAGAAGVPEAAVSSAPALMPAVQADRAVVAAPQVEGGLSMMAAPDTLASTAVHEAAVFPTTPSHPDAALPAHEQLAPPCVAALLPAVETALSSPDVAAAMSSGHEQMQQHEAMPAALPRDDESSVVADETLPIAPEIPFGCARVVDAAQAEGLLGEVLPLAASSDGLAEPAKACATGAASPVPQAHYALSTESPEHAATLPVTATVPAEPMAAASGGGDAATLASASRIDVAVDAALAATNMPAPAAESGLVSAGAAPGEDIARLEPPAFAAQGGVLEPVDARATEAVAETCPMPLEAPGRMASGCVAVVDETALQEAIYQRILPRMKVELSLWLQDAIENQTRHLLHGVMQQMKEDYDMLFGETLRESIRQAIADLGHQQEERK